MCASRLCSTSPGMGGGAQDGSGEGVQLQGPDQLPLSATLHVPQAQGPCGWAGSAAVLGSLTTPASSVTPAVDKGSLGLHFPTCSRTGRTAGLTPVEGSHPPQLAAPPGSVQDDLPPGQAFLLLVYGVDGAEGPSTTQTESGRRAHPCPRSRHWGRGLSASKPTLLH